MFFAEWINKEQIKSKDMQSFFNYNKNNDFN